jgi:hypothetical protein
VATITYDLIIRHIFFLQATSGMGGPTAGALAGEPDTLHARLSVCRQRSNVGTLAKSFFFLRGVPSNTEVATITYDFINCHISINGPMKAEERGLFGPMRADKRGPAHSHRLTVTQ